MNGWNILVVFAAIEGGGGGLDDDGDDIGLAVMTL